MGTWNFNALDNDTAADWTYSLDETSDFSLLETTLETVLSTREGYLEASAAEEGLAAAEALARAQGNSGESNAFSEAVDLWVERLSSKPPPDLVRMAHAAIDRILSPRSELLDLWKESGDDERWIKSITDLRTRIKG